MHYSYTCTYFWCVLLAHYIFRAITSNRLGGMLVPYCMLGYGKCADVVLDILLGVPYVVLWYCAVYTVVVLYITGKVLYIALYVILFFCTIVWNGTVY